jgi:RNA binding exosome subunit
MRLSKLSLFKFFLTCSAFFLQLHSLHSQNDYTCFADVRAKTEEIWLYPRRAVNGNDTVFAKPDYDKVLGNLKELIGCAMPDFSFFTTADKEYTISKISSEYTILYFSFIDCGDVCNDYLQQFSRLEDHFGDSITVINIYKQDHKKVKDFASAFPDNIEFVANAEILTRYYSMGGDQPVLYLLDKKKKIVMAEIAINSRNMNNVLYEKISLKIKEINCAYGN